MDTIRKRKALDCCLNTAGMPHDRRLKTLILWQPGRFARNGWWCDAVDIKSTAMMPEHRDNWRRFVASACHPCRSRGKGRKEGRIFSHISGLAFSFSPACNNRDLVDNLHVFLSTEDASFSKPQKCCRTVRTSAKSARYSSHKPVSEWTSQTHCDNSLGQQSGAGASPICQFTRRNAECPTYWFRQRMGVRRPVCQTL